MSREADEVHRAWKRWQSLVESAARGRCSVCFANDALREYVRLSNRRAARVLREVADA